MFHSLRRASAGLALLALACCFPQGSLTLCATAQGQWALEATCEPSGMPLHAEGHSGVESDHCGCSSGPCKDIRLGTELTAGCGRHDIGRSTVPLDSPALLPSFLAVAHPGALAPVRLAATIRPARRLAQVQAGVRLRI